MSRIKIFCFLLLGVGVAEKLFSSSFVFSELKDTIEVSVQANVNTKIKDSIYSIELELLIKNNSNKNLLLYYYPNNDLTIDSNYFRITNNYIHPYSNLTNKKIIKYDLTRFNMGIPGNRKGYLFDHESILIPKCTEKRICFNDIYSLKSGEKVITDSVLIRIVCFKDYNRDKLIKSMLKLNKKEYEIFVCKMIEKSECIEINKEIKLE